MTCKMRLKEDCCNTFLHIWPQPEKQREGQKYTFLERSFTRSPKISKSEPYELQEKSFCGRNLRFDVTYQSQDEMLLPLHL